MKFCPPFTPMGDLIVPGESGSWKLSLMTVSEEDIEFSKLRAMFNPRLRSMFYDAEPGVYARLSRASELVMTDTVYERRTNLGVLKRAKGSVLVAGLGVGMLQWALLDKPEVTRLVTVEKHLDVIALNKHMLWHPRTKIHEIICADIHDYVPTEKFDTIWFDIWSDTSADHVPEIGVLHKRWSPRRREGKQSFMASWEQKLMREVARE